MEYKKRPGGPLVGPIVQGDDGCWYDPVGKKLHIDSKDAAYANRFWSHNQPPGKIEVMRSNIESSAKRGTISHFVDPSGITERDREILSAYRVLAAEEGYLVGEFRFKKNSELAEASIKKE